MNISEFDQYWFTASSIASEFCLVVLTVLDSLEIGSGSEKADMELLRRKKIFARRTSQATILLRYEDVSLTYL